MELSKTESLLQEFDEHRAAIKVMIVDLEELKKNIDKILPQKLDARYIRFFEEKIKTITSLFNALLDMRKEIARSIKEELEIRRKLDKGDKEYDIEEMFDIREFADKVDEFKKENEKMRENLKKKPLDEYTDIVIPGVTERIIE